MSNHSSNDEHLEEIVAYLDGELVGESCARLERRLASDEDFRQELQSIERAWTALDELPMATVDDRFSRTTMGLIVDAAADDLRARTQALPVARRRRWATSALAASVALALGFLAFRLAWHDPNSPLLADLPVIDNVDIYSQFKEVEFLRLLRDELGGELEHLSGDVADLDDRQQHFANVSASERGAAWLEELDDEQRTNLRAKFNRFRELPLGEQERMRSLHQEIMTADDARRLERTMLAYQQWLGGLPPVRQFELRNMSDPSARVAQVKRWATQMRDDELLTLTDDELKAFFSELRGPIMRLRSQITRDDRRDTDDDRARLKTLLSQEFAKWRNELLEQFENERGGGRRWFYRAVTEALPGRSRPRFAGLPPEAKVERFLTWMRQHTACRGEVTQEELEHFFAEELNPAMRAQLLSLPPGEMEQALRRMYRCQPKSGAEGRWTWDLNGLINFDVLREPGDSEPNDGNDSGNDESDDEGDSANRGDREGDDRNNNRGEDGRNGDDRDGERRGEDGRQRDWDDRRRDGGEGDRGEGNRNQGDRDERDRGRGRGGAPVPPGFRPPPDVGPGSARMRGGFNRGPLPPLNGPRPN